MQIEQSGSGNKQHVGDVINHYYFGKGKGDRHNVKLPLKVCRIVLMLPTLIYMIPVFALPMYVVITQQTPPIHYLNYILFGFFGFIAVGWYLLPILFPNLLMTLYGDRLSFNDKTIMFTDIFRMERRGNMIELFLLDGREVSIHFGKEKCAKLVLEYYGMTVAI